MTQSHLSIAFKIEPLSESEAHLHELALTQAKDYLRSEAALLVTISKIDSCKLFQKFDLNSTHQYNLKYLRLSAAVSLNFINVARKSRQVPQLQTAILSGDLSVSKARKIVPVLTPSNQSEWIEKAKAMPQSQLEREVAEAAPEATARIAERAKPAKNNRVEIQFSWDSGAHELFLRLQDLASERLGWSASLEETFALAVGDSLERRDPLRKAARAQKKKSRKHEPAQTSPFPISQTKFSTRRSLSRDKRGPIPAEIVHVVNLRDGGKCQSRMADGSICGSTRFLHFHHILDWSKGGTHSADNLITLCGACHRRWHNRLHDSTPGEQTCAPG